MADQGNSRHGENSDCHSDGIRNCLAIYNAWSTYPPTPNITEYNGTSVPEWSELLSRGHKFLVQRVEVKLHSAYTLGSGPCMKSTVALTTVTVSWGISDGLLKKLQTCPKRCSTRRDLYQKVHPHHAGTSWHLLAVSTGSGHVSGWP